MSEAGFSGTKAATIVGITYRQLDYWARTDLIRPSLADASRQRQPAPVQLPRSARATRHQEPARRGDQARVGARPRSSTCATHLDTDIASAHLVISGSDVILCDGDQLIDVMRRGGQGVFNVLAIGGVKDDLDSTIVELGDGVDLPPRHARAM